MENAAVRERYDYLDLLKTCALLLVVFFHFNCVQADFFHNPSPVVFLRYAFFNSIPFAIPLFFFVNGCLLLNARPIRCKRHIVRILQMVLLTLIWGTATVCALMLIRGVSLPPGQVVHIVLGLRDGWLNHLWFMQALVVVYLFYPVIHAVYNTDKKSFYFFLGVVLFFTFGNHFLNELMDMALSFFPALLPSLHRNIYLTKQVNFFNNYNPFLGIKGYTVGCFMLGGVFFPLREKLNSPRFRKLAAAVLLLSLLLINLFGFSVAMGLKDAAPLTWTLIDSVPAMTAAIALFVLVLPYRRRENSRLGLLVRLTSENSLGIYLVHIIVGSALFPYFRALPFSAGLFVNLLFSAAVLLLTLAAVLAFKKIPYAGKFLLLAK